MPETYMLYSTFASKDEAISAAGVLVSEQLVACVNILDHVTSVYRWQGEVKQENEAIFLAKTSAIALPKALQRLRELHPYDTPCILAYGAHDGFKPYIQWVNNETGGCR